MRKHILLLGATLVGGVLFAQPSVIGVHPAPHIPGEPLLFLGQ